MCVLSEAGHRLVWSLRGDMRQKEAAAVGMSDKKKKKNITRNTDSGVMLCTFVLTTVGTTCTTILHMCSFIPFIIVSYVRLESVQMCIKVKKKLTFNMQCSLKMCVWARLALKQYAASLCRSQSKHEYSQK